MPRSRKSSAPLIAAILILVVLVIVVVILIRRDSKPDEQRATPTQTLEHRDAFGKPVPEHYADIVQAFRKSGTALVFRDYGPFAVWLDPDTRISVVAVHWLTEHRYKNLSERPAFYPDDTLPADLRIKTSEYGQKVSGGLGPFDRGHLVPMNDMDSVADECKSFITTNIAPQQSELNRGPWEELEEGIRSRVAVRRRISKSPSRSPKTLLTTLLTLRFFR